MKRIIEIIGKKVLDELYKFDNNDYNIEKTDPNFPEVYDTTEASMDFNGDLNKRYFFNGSVKVVNGRLGYIEVFDYDEQYPNIEKAVQEYVNANFNADEWYSELIDYNESLCEDEWQSHGFRDEADYWRYRMGA